MNVLIRLYYKHKRMVEQVLKNEYCMHQKLSIKCSGTERKHQVVRQLTLGGCSTEPHYRQKYSSITPDFTSRFSHSNPTNKKDTYIQELSN